jgi:hypothetical protein
MPEYRQQRSHTDFITTLHSHFSSIDQISSSLESSLGSTYDLNIVSSEELDEEVASALGERKKEEVARSTYETY